ncbi:hypothetical protein IV203_029373 [Nitzschia inconspicua]|uniref:Secreted protein n=1 Tax=Nitzschia inconspicua TaxID=303405 RepID=A0A9K3Q0P8_9STRA|nr:hypothetical protein IV203_029373 [Nitzschia inconspicua]
MKFYSPSILALSFVLLGAASTVLAQTMERPLLGDQGLKRYVIEQSHPQRNHPRGDSEHSDGHHHRGGFGNHGQHRSHKSSQSDISSKSRRTPKRSSKNMSHSKEGGGPKEPRPPIVTMESRERNAI